jgi:hypothetical protein
VSVGSDPNAPPKSKLQFVMYPMMHMAEPRFYAAVTARLRNADVVVAEGVGSSGPSRRSTLVSALMLSYRVLRFNRRMTLVDQDINYAALTAEVVHPDVSVAEFQAGWRRVPLKQRLGVWCLLPAIIVVRLFGGARLAWSRWLEQNDLPSPEEEAMAEAMPELDAAFGGRRDDRLLDTLSQLHERRGTEPIEVAVVYGAGHVRAIVAGLTQRHGYRVRSADWLTVTDR